MELRIKSFILFTELPAATFNILSANIQVWFLFQFWIGIALDHRLSHTGKENL
jgi:hypothetical protein